MPVSSPQRRSVELPEPPTTWPPVRETGRLPRRPRRSLPGFLRLGPGEREVLWLYLLTRIGVWATAGAVGWLFPADGQAREPASLLSPWQQWDWWFYLHIAQDGYFPGQAGPWTAGWDNREAFLPGLPSSCAPSTPWSPTGPRPAR